MKKEEEEKVRKKGGKRRKKIGKGVEEGGGRGESRSRKTKKKKENEERINEKENKVHPSIPIPQNGYLAAFPVPLSPSVGFCAAIRTSRPVRTTNLPTCRPDCPFPTPTPTATRPPAQKLHITRTSLSSVRVDLLRFA